MKYNLNVVTDKGPDMYKDCGFTIEDDILCIKEGNSHFCYPLVNVILYVFEPVETVDD